MPTQTLSSSACLATSRANPPQPAIGAPPVRPGRPTWFRRLVLSQMRPMQAGHLRMELPEGRTIEFGRLPEPRAHLLPTGIGNCACIRVRRESFFRRCALAGDIGFAEAYVDGDWDTPDLAAVVAWALLNVARAPTLSGSRRRGAGAWVFNLMRLLNRAGHQWRSNSRRMARRNIGEHYDLSNEFFRLMLDPTMMYSSARWADADQTLEEAQQEKNERLCRLLRLRPADHVLEIGCGWGGWAIHAARRHGCRVTAITLSERQFTLAWDRVQAAGVSDRVDVQLRDFRDIRGRYDKVVSIEMMEALGHRYLPEFCRRVSRALAPQGLLALQFITCPDARYGDFRRGVDFIQKHIFPGSLLLSANRVNDLLSREGGFVLNHLEDFGPDYARTLRRWRENLAGQAFRVRELGFDERFHRRWDYYLQYCEAAFALRNISVVQTLHTRPNNLAL